MVALVIVGCIISGRVISIPVIGTIRACGLNI